MSKFIFVLLMLAIKAQLLHAQPEIQKIKASKAKSSVAVELLKMNVLYVGIDNPVNIVVSNTNNFTVVMASGTIVKNENHFIIRESVQGVDTLFIYDTKNKLIDKKLFRVKPIPKPIVCIGQHCGNSTISKKELLVQMGLIATLQNFDFDLYLKITSFEMSVRKSDNQVEMLNSSSNLFTNEMKKLIETLPEGTKITFENIDAIGFDGQVRSLEPMSIYLK